MKLSQQQQKRVNDFIAEAKKLGVLEWVKKIKKEYPKAEVYLVGGAVRDALLKRKTKDYDFVVRGLPAKHLQNFLSQLGWVDLVGKGFGVFKFIPKNIKKDGEKLDALDIALPRTEYSIGMTGGYHDFKIQSDHRLPLADDLKRRDFTINALAIRIDDASGKFELVDEFSGLNDLNKKIIRTVGKPEERFREDYSRLLRAIRFTGQLGFAVENKTATVIKKMITHMNDKKKNNSSEYVVPRETVAKEILKTFLASPVKAFDLCDEFDIFKNLMPEILAMKGCQQPTNYHSEGDVWTHTRLGLEYLDSKLFSNQFKKSITKNTTAQEMVKYDSELILAVLLHDIAKPVVMKTPEKDGVKKIQYYDHDVVGGKMAQSICERLKFSAPDKIGAKAEMVNWLVAKHMMLVHGKIDQMKPTKIEKYFLSDFYPGENLLKLAFIDAVATVPAGRYKPVVKKDLNKWISMEGFLIALNRIRAIQKMAGQRKIKPKPFLNGQEIMQILKISAGKQVGEVLEILREAQLAGQIKNKKEAQNFIAKLV